MNPPHQPSHGQTVERHGTPAPSHTTLTGMVVSGAEEVTMRSTPVCWINSVVTVLAIDGSDCEFFTVTSILYFFLPIVMPLANWLALRTRLRTNLSGPAKSASDPVDGVT